MTVPSISNISFEDILKNLRITDRGIHDSKRDFDPMSLEKLLHPLKITCDAIGSSQAPKKVIVPKEYMQHWYEFIDNKRESINHRALRYLCWEPDIAVDKKFVDYAFSQEIGGSARALQGLVRSCHLRWSLIFKESIFAKDTVLDKIKKLIQKYQGLNQIILNWKKSSDLILDSKAPELFASEMVKTKEAVKEHTDSWAVDIQSEFAKEAILSAVKQCRLKINTDLDKCKYLFSELLVCPTLSIAEVKKEVGDIIMDDNLSNSEAREVLQKFLLSDSRLGDPRLPRNHRNWVDMSNQSKERFIQWLSRADIVFFFEHVLPAGHDPHGRKDFWLRYIKNNCKASRPMLCSNDADRLRTVLLKDSAKVGHFGKVYSYSENSVFLLDFGSIIAVEFSKMGACYIYKSDVFKEIYPNFWDDSPVREGKFKDQRLCMNRIVHNRSWKNELGNFLAQNGIRPSTYVY